MKNPVKPASHIIGIRDISTRAEVVFEVLDSAFLSAEAALKTPETFVRN